MKIIDFIKNPIGSIIQSRVEREVSKRITAAVDRQKEDETWRRITDVKRLRDLPPIKQDKMIKIVDWLRDRNPQAKRILGLTTDFVVGDGITFKAEDEKVQEILDKFWTDNQWELRQFDRIEELGGYGEQAYRVFVNKYDGRVTIGSIDPEQVSKIILNPENAEELIGMQLKTGDEILEIIRVNRKLKKISEPFKEAKVSQKLRRKTKESANEFLEKQSEQDNKYREPDRLYGEVFFFYVNKGSHATRGKSDLLVIADWLDKYDKTLYTMTERVAFLLAFIWDVLIEGADESVLKKRNAELKDAPPKPGSYIVHNEREKWEAKSPDLRGRDFTDFFKLLKSQLASGSGFPGHWLFGFGDDINKAVSQEISEPTYRQLKRRQTYVRHMVQFMFRFVIEQSIEKKKLPEDVDRTVAVNIPDPSRKEAAQIADTISKLTPALAIASSSNFIDEDTARQVFTTFISQLGVEVKAEEVEKKIKKATESSSLYEAINKVWKMMDKGKKK